MRILLAMNIAMVFEISHTHYVEIDMHIACKACKSVQSNRRPRFLKVNLRPATRQLHVQCMDLRERWGPASSLVCTPHQQHPQRSTRHTHAPTPQYPYATQSSQQSGRIEPHISISTTLGAIMHDEREFPRSLLTPRRMYPSLQCASVVQSFQAYMRAVESFRESLELRTKSQK